jgi:hypothetical protein
MATGRYRARYTMLDKYRCHQLHDSLGRIVEGQTAENDYQAEQVLADLG